MGYDIKYFVVTSQELMGFWHQGTFLISDRNALTGDPESRELLMMTGSQHPTSPGAETMCHRREVSVTSNFLFR
jgi:hypothetical protein